MTRFWDFNGFSSSDDEEFWRQNVRGTWATLVVLFLIFLWHYFRTFSFSFSFSSRFVSASSSSSSSSFSSSPASAPNPVAYSGAQAPRIGVPEIVSDADLKFLIEKLDGKPSEDEKWDKVIEKSNNRMSYTAQCCKPKEAPLKYLSSTIFENCSPETLRDFYMDNEYRKLWDKTVVSHCQLDLDENSGIEIGRTVKKFPLLTAREYVLAWRLWEGKDKTFYCFIKDCEHPSVPKQRKYVRVSYFRSGWRIRKVPGRNASEIQMFHQEDAGLNVEMAKLAFSKGIWSFVVKMDEALRLYPTVRRPPSSPNAVTLLKMVPAELDTLVESTSQSSREPNAVQGTVSVQQKKLSRIPSKKMVANSLLLIGGVICLTRGHSGLSAKVAMAYILNKLNNRGASSRRTAQDRR